MNRALHSIRDFSRALLCAVAFAAVTGLIACKDTRSGSTIEAIPERGSHESLLNERAGMEEIAAAHKLRIDWQGPRDAVLPQQVDLLARTAQDRYYGVVVDPAGERNVSEAISDVLTHGVPVVVLRDPIAMKSQAHLSAVLEDDDAGSRLLARRLATLFRTARRW